MDSGDDARLGTRVRRGRECGLHKLLQLLIGRCLRRYALFVTIGIEFSQILLIRLHRVGRESPLHFQIDAILFAQVAHFLSVKMP